MGFLKVLENAVVRKVAYRATDAVINAAVAKPAKAPTRQQRLEARIAELEASVARLEQALREAGRIKA